VFAVYISFDVKGYIEKLRTQHPHWSEEELQDWNLWNRETKEMLAAEIMAFLARHQEYTVVECPEAMGINITETAALAGIPLEWQEPIATIHRIALAGVKI